MDMSASLCYMSYIKVFLYVTTAHVRVLPLACAPPSYPPPCDTAVLEMGSSYCSLQDKEQVKSILIPDSEQASCGSIRYNGV